MNIGLIGCGNISAIYLKNRTLFSGISLTKCADLREDAARARATEFDLAAVSVDALLNDPDIDVILNLTTPQAHTEIDLRAVRRKARLFGKAVRHQS